MKLELSFFTVTAALSCVLFLLRDDGTASYARERATLFFRFTAVSFLSAVIASSIVVYAVHWGLTVTYLLPLVSVITALVITSLLQKLCFFVCTGRFTNELMLTSSVLTVFLMLGVTEDIIMSLVYLVVSSALFAVSSVLLYFTVVRFTSYGGEKQPRFLLSAAICASALGFAAEGFKGILEKLFT